MADGTEDPARPRELFKRELFGVDEPLGRVVDYFKAAAAGSDVGRRLLLLLGPPSGGKSTMAILLKRGLEEYSRTDEGALYALQGLAACTSRRSTSIPASLRAEFRETYGVEIRGELEPLGPRPPASASSRAITCKMPVERVFLAEADARRASAPTRRTIRRPPTSRTWWARSTCRRSRSSATKAIRARGRGRAPCTRRAAACSR